MGVVRVVRLLFWYRNHDGKHHRPIFARLLRLLQADGRWPSTKDRGPVRVIVWTHEYLCPIAGRNDRRPMWKSLGILRASKVAVWSTLLRGSRFAVFLASDDADCRHTAARRVWIVRQDVERRHVFGS